MFFCVLLVVVDVHPACRTSELWSFVQRDRLAKHVRVDDPRMIPSCAHEAAWFRSPPQISPLASDQISVAALPILEPRESDSSETTFMPTWLEFAFGAPPRFCIVEIDEPAIVLPNGLVVTRSRRYDLGMDWETMASTPACASARVATSDVYSFRFKYSFNAKRSSAKMLPLLSLAESRILAENASVLSSGSALFDFAVPRVMPSVEFITAKNQPVLARRVRLIVRHPDDANVPHYWQRHTEINGAFPAGVASGFARRLYGAARPASGQRPKLLYLPRTTTSATPKLSSTGRHFDNEHLLISLTQRLADELGFDFVLFTFTTIQAQQQAFSEADIVAGPQGTGSSGLVFAKKDIIMLEFILQRYDSVELMNAWHPEGAYVALHPHWYYGSNAKRPSTCGGTCTGWHLTTEDLQAWEWILRCLLSSNPACRARALSASTSAVHWPSIARIPAYPSWPNRSAAARTCTLLRNAVPTTLSKVMHLGASSADSAQVRAFKMRYSKQYEKDARVCGERSSLRQPW